MKKWFRDYGLAARMILTMFLLAAVYLFFLAVLSAYGGVGTYGLIVFAGFFLIIQFFLSDKLVLWSMGGRIVSEQEEPRLHQTVSRLCAIADLPKPKIAVVESSVPNAFATGRSKGSAVVAVTTSLRQRLSQAELEAVLAHELSHVKNRDVLVITIASFFSTIASFLVQNMLFFGMGGPRPQGCRSSDNHMGRFAYSMDRQLPSHNASCLSPDDHKRGHGARAVARFKRNGENECVFHHTCHFRGLVNEHFSNT